MSTPSDVINDYNILFNGKKAHSLGVSTKLLDLNVNKYSTNFTRLIKTTNSKEELNNILKSELLGADSNSFYNYSILMGLSFGVYNLYCYIPLSSDIIRKILKTKPNRTDTCLFFKNYHKELVTYFNEKYNLTDNEYKSIVDKMFGIIEDDSLYNNDIVRDIGKILMGSKLLFTKEEINSNDPKVKINIINGTSLDYFNKFSEEDEYITRVPKR